MVKNHKLFVVLFVILFYSCVDCKKLDLSYRNDNLEVVLTAKPIIYGDMKFVGTELNSSKINTAVMVRRWYREYIDYMQVGDFYSSIMLYAEYFYYFQYICRNKQIVISIKYESRYCGVTQCRKINII